MKNITLFASIDEIIKDPRNVIVQPSTVSGNAIEVTYRNSPGSDHFCYYDRVDDRDADLNKLIELLKERDKNIN